MASCSSGSSTDSAVDTVESSVNEQLGSIDVSGRWTGTATLARLGEDPGQADMTVTMAETGPKSFDFEVTIARPNGEVTFDGAGVKSPSSRLLGPCADLGEGMLVDSQIVSEDEITWMAVEVFEPTDEFDFTPESPKKVAIIAQLTRAE